MCGLTRVMSNIGGAPEGAELTALLPLACPILPTLSCFQENEAVCANVSTFAVSASVAMMAGWQGMALDAATVSATLGNMCTEPPVPCGDEGVRAALGSMGGTDTQDMSGMIQSLASQVDLGALLQQCDRPLAVRHRMRMNVEDPAAFVQNPASQRAVERAVARQSNADPENVEAVLSVVSRRLEAGFSRSLQAGSINVESTIHVESADDVETLQNNVNAIEATALNTELESALAAENIEVAVTVPPDSLETAVAEAPAVESVAYGEQQATAEVAMEEERVATAETTGNSAGPGVSTTTSAGTDTSAAMKAPFVSAALMAVLAAVM